METSKAVLSKVTRYEFAATVYIESLDSELLLFGEYSVDWDDDIPMISVDNCFTEAGGLVLRIDYDDLALQIEDTQQDYWYEDRIAAAADNYYEDR